VQDSEQVWADWMRSAKLVRRVPDSKEPRGIGVFGRVIGAPKEQNLVDFYADGGVTDNQLALLQIRFQHHQAWKRPPLPFKCGSR
jgi:hypothetical protein